MATLIVKSAASASTKQLQIVAGIAGVQLTVQESTGASEPALAASAFNTLPILVLPSGSSLSRAPAIARYLAGVRADSTLYGRTVFEEAQVDAWVDALVGDLATVAALLDYPLDTLPAQQREKSLANGNAKLHSILAVTDKHLASSTYFVGERITLADVLIATSFLPLFEKVIPSTSQPLYPHTFRWFLTCVNQRSFSAVLGPVTLLQSASAGDKPAAAASGKGKKQVAPAKQAAPAKPVAVASGAGGASGGVVALPTGLFTRSRVRVKEALASGESLIGQTITVSGWVRSLRAQATLGFMSISDGSCLSELQLILSQSGDFVTTGYEDATKTTTGCSITAVGKVVASPKPNQPVEVQVADIKVVGWCDPTVYPMSKKKHSPEHLRAHQHLRMRTNMFGAATRVRDSCAFATHKFFNERGFLYIHTPLITASDCEGAGEMFQVTTLIPDDPKAAIPRTKDGSIDYEQDFFKAKANLTVSGQLQVECFAVSMGDVYTFGPTFRAEKSDTYRHLAEFWMIEPEICFADVFDDMNLAEDFIKFVVSYVLEHNSDDIAFFNSFVDPEKALLKRLQDLIAAPFQRITYTEAIELLLKPENLKAGNFKEKPYWGIDLASEHERFITEKIFKKPTFIRDYPKEIKSFYMKLNPDGKTVAAMDLIVPGIGELIGGSQREDNFELLTQRIVDNGMDPKAYDWYLDLRKYGSAPHAGFGVGFERLVMYTTSIPNIRDVIPFPRYFHGRADV